MKLCNNCNTQNNDSATFCGACGAVLNASGQAPNNADAYQNPQNMYQGQNIPPQNTPQNTYPGQNNYNYQNEQYSYQQQNPNTMYNNPYMPQQGYSNAIPILKSICSSSLYLVAAIVITAGLAFGIVASLSNPSNLFGQVPSVFLLCGIWHLYFYGKNPQSNSTKGLSFLKTSFIIYIVFAFILLAFILLAWLALSMFAQELGGAFGAGIVAVIMIILLITLALIITYLFIALRCVKSIRQTVTTGTVNLKGLSVLSVLLYIISVINFLSSLSSLFTVGASSELAQDYLNNFASSFDVPTDLLSSMAGLGYIAIISSILVSVAMFLFALIISKYKKAVT